METLGCRPGTPGRGLLSSAQREWPEKDPLCSARLSGLLDPPGRLRGHHGRQPLAGLDEGRPGWDGWDMKEEEMEEKEGEGEPRGSEQQQVAEFTKLTGP